MLLSGVTTVRYIYPHFHAKGMQNGKSPQNSNTILGEKNMWFYNMCKESMFLKPVKMQNSACWHVDMNTE